MEVLVIRLIDQLLEELSKDNKLVVSITGPLMDSATVAVPTFFAGLVAGPVGAVLGAALGTGALAFSKVLGYGNYKPLMTVLREDFSEEERNELYQRMWEKLAGFATSPLTQNLAYQVLEQLSSAALSNPDVLENIRNEILQSLKKKNMAFKS